MSLGGNVFVRGNARNITGRISALHIKNLTRQSTQLKIVAPSTHQQTRRRFRVHSNHIFAMDTTTGTQSVSGRMNELKESQRCVLGGYMYIKSLLVFI